jgi:heme ABC exporter ATP-binding subunit CcmA
VEKERMMALKAGDLSKNYGHYKALDDVSFELAAGEALFVWGKNGAGKTTLLEIVAGLRRQSGGTLELFGLDPRRNIIEIQKQFSCVLEDSFLYGDLTLEENLTFWGQILRIDQLDEKISLMLERLGLTHKKNSLVRQLSRGLERRGSFARAFLASPKLLILDEATDGLDDESRKVVTAILKEHISKGGSIIFTNHNYEEGVSLASKVMMLEAGKNLFFGTPKGIPR